MCRDKKRDRIIRDIILPWLHGRETRRGAGAGKIGTGQTEVRLAGQGPATGLVKQPSAVATMKEVLGRFRDAGFRPGTSEREAEKRLPG